MEVVLHEDKKYYPTLEEVYGEEVEVSRPKWDYKVIWSDSVTFVIEIVVIEY